MKKILSNVIKFIHWIIIIFLAVGYLLPLKFLFFYNFLCPLMLGHWLVNDRRCILTEIECWLLDMPYTPLLKTEFEYHVACFFLLGLWLISMYRYYN